MKILIIENCDFVSYPTGGQLTFVRNMMAAFGTKLKLVGCSVDNSHPVGKWTTKGIDGKSYDYFSVQTVDKSVEKPFVPRRITAYFAFRRYVRRILNTEYDAIFVQAPEALYALPESVLNKTYVDLPGLSNPVSNSRYKLTRWVGGIFAALYYKRLEKVKMIWATASETEISKFIANSNGHVKSMVQLPTRYDSSIFKVEDKEECRRRLGLALDKIIFVTVGRLNRNKGWQLMVDAFILSDIPDSMFYIIGNGEDETLIKEYVAEKKLESRIILTGRKSAGEIAEYLNAADLFLMGSVAEGWSTTLVEACACGVPCVVTDFSSASDMVGDGLNGFVVKTRDAGDFSEKMKCALALDRVKVGEYAARFGSLAISHLPECMFTDIE